MATNINIPIPQNPIGENYPWRDWFQKLSNKVYGSLASQNSNGVTITGGTIDNTAIGSTTPSTGSFTDLTTSTLAVNGGTNGQLLIGRTSDHRFLPATLTAGTNITITNAASSITIAASGGFYNIDGGFYNSVYGGTTALDAGGP